MVSSWGARLLRVYTVIKILEQVWLGVEVPDYLGIYGNLNFRSSMVMVRSWGARLLRVYTVIQILEKVW